MSDVKKSTPNYLWSMLTMRCPRCRRGDMFKNTNSYKKITLKHIFDMHENCPVCNQRYDMGEPGFWYGTGYVSYALAVGISATTFVAWLVLIGVSFNDNRVFYWLSINTFLLIVLQPWMMRMSRVIYLQFFVSYNKDYESTKAKTLDY
ncbi:hypothetical protein BH09BAC2_BH09BAC2_08330 [soil metagenome]